MVKKIVLTGAAGRLGGYLRKPLVAKCETLVSTDIAPLTDPLIKGESFCSGGSGRLRKDGGDYQGRGYGCPFWRPSR